MTRLISKDRLETFLDLFHIIGKDQVVGEGEVIEENQGAFINALQTFVFNKTITFTPSNASPAEHLVE